MNEIEAEAEADSSASGGRLVLSACGRNIEVMSPLVMPTPSAPAGRVKAPREDRVVLAGMLSDV